jgi:hypothetical protein|tara:strand:- start:1379 stop:1660 length:282 start_codon:yes stop_codon:yes gene_type:complete
MHPSNSFPRNAVILSGTNAYTGEVVFAVYNPTAAAISATIKGSFTTYDSTTDDDGNALGYVEDAGDQSVSIQSGHTLYGRFTSVSGGDLICYF